ncbi:MAG: LPS export ABC transporter periplasmic protein LptC [Bacteroidales bacterium]|jgi:LPS export ABC transporter protein LptC|nr:LPS export ABC transporter periplasmic protein LptC [Bacteroidales bacterium]
MKLPRYASKILKRIKHVCITAIFMEAVMFLSSCENNIEQIKAFGLTEAMPIIEASNFETVITDSGVVRYFLKAPKLMRFENERESYFEFPEGIELIRYNEDGEIISSITANYAKQFEKEKKWEVKNNVIATNMQGDTLKTEQLFYTELEGEIYTDEFVRIIRSEQNITGVGFQSDQTLQNWRIRQPKGSIDVSMNNQNSEQPVQNGNDINNSDEAE